ncbi:MAG TPA: outer membrane beta-barrel family protein [Saprospiraceae bacterium]|nr:outer membrane beta-barrel family protein [Saprospiraceae bacterium]
MKSKYSGLWPDRHFVASSPYLTILFILLIQFPVLAQQSSLNGKVLDVTEEALPFANVLLKYPSDSSLAKVAVTDEQGTFEIVGVEAGNYLLQISYVGLPSLLQAISINRNEQKDLGSLLMQTSEGETLGEVTVEATRPLIELKGDKMVFNIENSINAGGSNGLELLRKAPGVLLDNNNNITMLGRTGVRIFINGRPSPLRGEDLASYLEGLQSTDIDAIEIITNPGSKYEAEGNAGIINIKLRKDSNLGANGTLNLSYGIGIRPRYSGGLSGNYRNKFMNLYGSYSYTQSNPISNLNFDRRQFGFVLSQRNLITAQNTPQNFKAGADFFLSDKSTLGILVEGGSALNQNNARGRTTLGTVDQMEPDSILIVNSPFESKRFNLNYNLNYEWKISKSSSLSIDANYGTFDRTQGTFLSNRYYTPDETTLLSVRDNQIDTDTDIRLSALKVDYERELWSGKLGVGGKITQINTDNDFDFFNFVGANPVLNTDRSNRFQYNENVNALYFNYSKRISDKINYQIGLRMEQTNSEGNLIAQKEGNNQNIKRSYLDWFPSASLNIKMNPDNQLQLSYSRRINRPSYGALNPFEYQLDELTFHKGNPFLQPEYSNIYQIRHAYKFKINTTLSYSRTADMMALQPQAGEGKVSFRTWLNLQKQDNYSINIAAPTPINDWWSSLVSVTAYYRRNRSAPNAETVVDLQATAYNLYSQQSFKISKKFSMELSGFYNSATINQGATRARPMYRADLGAKLKILQGSGNLSVTFNDFLNTMRWQGDVVFGELDMTIVSDWDSRRLRVNFSYLFGNKKVKSRKRKTALEEEKSRANGN